MDIEGQIPDPVTVPLWFDLLAVFIGGLSGSLFAQKKHFDVGGVLVIATVSALGGGMIRDVLMGIGAPAALRNPDYLYTALGAAAVGFLFGRTVQRITPYFILINAATLAAFTLVGMDKGLRADLPVVTAILLGVVTATGGGLLRDVLSGSVPDVLQPGHLTLTASVIGALEFAIADYMGIRNIGLWLVFATIMMLNLGSYWFGWRTPEADDVSEGVTAVGATIVHAPRRILATGTRSTTTTTTTNPSETT